MVAEDITSHFFVIAKKNEYTEAFSKLGYWNVIDFESEKVIELQHREETVSILLLYFQEQELTIAIALRKPGFSLTLKDKRIQHFVQAVLRDSL